MRLLERLIYKFARKVKPQNTTRTGLIATSRILRRLQRVDHTHRSKLRFVSEVTERKTEEITNSSNQLYLLDIISAQRVLSKIKYFKKITENDFHRFVSFIVREMFCMKQLFKCMLTKINLAQLISNHARDGIHAETCSIDQC
ncbi:hypothetical protein HNY73_008828 [Argiope bruennichi]|uniref:Uncharacterized protein n=1 Tax=Argiope bruennichi TaxID=94029 RepID=A0A8T0FAF5_ARGBR|nr:hypothetical protein HNY73_008828 [Argiope bruennichi]